MIKLENSRASNVFKFFEEISNIPRGSGNEKEISDYLVKFAKDHGLEVIQDEALNVIIKKPASKGYEKAPIVILQGHIDMVCEKNIGTDHDFEKDPIKLVVKGDKIYADGTTLGADNGIAVAYAMAILADDSIKHPALEVLLTSDEETGMTGAMAVSKENIDGKILLNLDNEDEGSLLVSCAGGIRTRSIIKSEKVSYNGKTLFNVKIRGLKGGHSGAEIHTWRGNANKLMGRVLKELVNKTKLSLVSINGGSKNNAIPREADAIIAIDASEREVLISTITEFDKIFKNELQAQDAGVVLSVEEYTSEENKIFTEEGTKKIVDLLYLYPNGINTMSRNIEGLTESSTNLGIVITNNNEVEFDSAVRSSIPSLKEDIVLKIKTITELLGAKFEANAGYPAWEYKKESKIRDLCVEVYKKMYEKEPVVYAIHAGVECGLFEERLGNLDMISFGPNIRDAHTPEENLSISSTENVWDYLLEVLKNINNNY